MKRFNAQSYRKSIISGSKLYEVELPSGFTFTLRRPNVQAFVATGNLPSYLLQQMIEVQQGGTPEPVALEKLSADELSKTYLFLGALVKEACVTPKIVESPRNDDEIRALDLSDPDFLFIVNWCKGAGGVEGENLAQFRQKS